MINKVSRASVRTKKHRRMRHHIVGTAQRPRLAVFRSNNHMYAQIIDDTVGKTLVSASTLQKDVKAELEQTNTVAAAAYLGTVIGKKACLLYTSNPGWYYGTQCRTSSWKGRTAGSFCW